ncbi:MAG: hypothetical protein RLZZ385_1501 [Pseudomonadota bacterium]|jgi:hypothetical protein
MNVQQIKTIAKERGLKPGKLAKTDLIRLIQQEEGNFACFGTAITGECDQTGCLWREDCLASPSRLQ